MKSLHKYLLIIALMITLLTACDEVKLSPFSGRDQIQFSNPDNKSEITADFFWAAALDPEADTDTLWLSLQTVGFSKSTDRFVRLVQDTAYNYDLVYDKVGNLVDSIKYAVANQAKANKHYVNLDDPGLLPMLKMPANQYTARIPVVMKKDTTVNKKLTLDLRLIPVGETELGEPRMTKCRITIQ